MRFLADHIDGGVYYRIHRENHNLDHCRTQFKPVADREEKMDEMKVIVKKCCKNRDQSQLIQKTEVGAA